jgi:hypothetical protein
MPDVTRLTRRQAEKAAGVSRATLARYVADSRLSATKDENGHNVYDASELARVFPDSFNLKRLEDAETGETPDADRALCPPEAAERDTRLAVLEVEKAHLTEERERQREEIERLRRELGEERTKREAERAEFMSLLRQKEQTVKLLTDQTNQTKRKGIFARLFGGDG